jgi:hypothetical protein
MRYRVIIVFGLIFLAAAAVVADSRLSVARAADDTAALLQASHANLDAFNRHDAAGMLRFESSSFVHVHDDGSVTGRDEHLQFAPYPDTAHWISQSVRLIGDIAIVSGTAEETEQYTGGAIVSHYHRTEIWVHDDGRWLIEQQQVTIIPPANHPATIPTPKHLDQYAGQYEWAPDYVETMTVKNGRLYSDVAGTSPDLLYFVGPESITEKDDPAIGTFYRDAGGGITGYLYRTCYGETIRIPRIR